MFDQICIAHATVDHQPRDLSLLRRDRHDLAPITAFVPTIYLRDDNRSRFSSVDRLMQHEIVHRWRTNRHRQSGNPHSRRNGFDAMGQSTLPTHRLM
jgi:hypothetical protein